MNLLSGMNTSGQKTGLTPNSGEATPVERVFSGPMVEVSRSNYRLRLANCEKDVRDAQLLRFVVFNLELNEGLEQSYATCLDSDKFDAVCDHLIVENLKTNEVIGTYRLQTGRKALENFGYYSAQEFDFKPFEAARDQIVELGRACVHADHRNLTVITLLWKGIAAYLTGRNCRYMLGCSSLTSQDPAEGLSAYDQLRKNLAPEAWRTVPLPGLECVTDKPLQRVKIPKLLSAYMMLGSKICGPPAIDREFKTVDFLTFLDLYSLSPKNFARYLT